jgi:uncharacterized membrane protein HdeD (DUF308 family)
LFALISIAAGLLVGLGVITATKGCQTLVGAVLAGCGGILGAALTVAWLDGPHWLVVALGAVEIYVSGFVTARAVAS